VSSAEPFCHRYELTRSSFFPVILQALRQTPIIGTFLSLPYIRGVSPGVRGVGYLLINRPRTSWRAYARVRCSGETGTGRRLQHQACIQAERHNGPQSMNINHGCVPSKGCYCRGVGRLRLYKAGLTVDTPRDIIQLHEASMNGLNIRTHLY